jgi:hypothetical protein
MLYTERDGWVSPSSVNIAKDGFGVHMLGEGLLKKVVEVRGGEVFRLPSFNFEADGSLKTIQVIRGRFKSTRGHKRLGKIECRNLRNETMRNEQRLLSQMKYKSHT